MDSYLVALDLAQTLLSQEADPTPEVIRAVLEKVRPLAPGLSPGDESRLAVELERRFNIWVGKHSLLEDQTGHEPWLDDSRSSIDWKFWQRYRRYLEKKRGFSPPVLKDMDSVTDIVLGRLEHPKREGRWNRRGMVVGSVQSGKTANYLGLICKAIDSGYPLVIVLAGMLNNLRSQTQIRLDQGVLGFDTRLNLEFDQDNQRIGAGAMPGEPLLIASSYTSSAEKGDFNRTVARTITAPLGGNDPVVLVVKKNKSVLENLIAWCSAVRGERDPSTGKRIIRGVPMLLIDDEADHASVNTAEFTDEDGQIDPELDPTTINKLIRKLLQLFEKRSYVGYTATPFANIFIHPEAKAEAAGDDLFPASFIFNLQPPSNYIGPVEVFGINPDSDEDDDENSGTKGLPIIRDVKDDQAFIPRKHSKDLDLSGVGLPQSLRSAIRAFILSCAGKLARRMEKTHASMLVHVTRFNDVQAQVADKVKEELEYLQLQLEFGPDPRSEQLFAELEKMWIKDFQKTTNAISKEIDDPQIVPVAWSEIRPLLNQAASRIGVKVVNGSAKDALDYADHPNGLWTIAIGGDKLSRGLTLEGLSVSYFTRTSRMYDTLMQMGRWFGYRPGYVDLCRLYTCPLLVGWYRHIATATEELRAELDRMIDVKGTPLDYGLKVASHPNGLLVTAANKMRAAKMARISYAGTISESVAFERDAARVERNFAAFDAFISGLGDSPTPRDGCLVWDRVPGEVIASMFGNVTTHELSWKAQSGPLKAFIEKQLLKNELKFWTVGLVASGRGVAVSIGGHDLRSGIRNSNGTETAAKYAIGRLVSPQHEWLDLTPSQYQVALEATRADWVAATKKRGKMPKRPSGPNIRRQRDPESGLLLIYPIDRKQPGTPKPLVGFAASFPFSTRAEAVEYAVNKVGWDQEFR